MHYATYLEEFKIKFNTVEILQLNHLVTPYFWNKKKNKHKFIYM